MMEHAEQALYIQMNTSAVIHTVMTRLLTVLCFLTLCVLVQLSIVQTFVLVHLIFHLQQVISMCGLKQSAC